MLPRWGLFVEPPVGKDDIDTLELLAEVEGSREEALEHLRNWVVQYKPKYPMRPRRQRLYRMDDGWLVINEGSFGRRYYPCRFRVCELVWDSDHN